MRRFILALSLLLALATSAPARAQEPAAVDAPLSSAFTYQGRLTKGGAPVTATCAMTFSLWPAASGGTQVGASQAIAAVPVADGLFTVTLNGGGQFGAAAFDGQARFLETSVQCPGDAAPTLLPRQQITASPYALTALRAIVADSANTANTANGLQGNPVGAAAPTPGQVLTWNGSAWVPAALPAAAPDWNALTNKPAGFADNIDNEGWELDGNGGLPPTARLGTTDAVTLTVVASNTLAARVVANPGTAFDESQPNWIGGSFVNFVAPNVQAAFIGGGGRSFNSFAPNQIFDSFGVIVGGIDNTVGVNDGNPNSQNSGTVGGGFSNEVTDSFAVVGGGRQNAVADDHGTVGGGQNNEVRAGGRYGVIPGGFGAVVNQYGQFAHAGGFFNNTGDAQHTTYILRNVTNSTTQRELFLDCNKITNSNLGGGTPCTSGERITPANGRALAYQLRVIARVGVSTNVLLPVNSTVVFTVQGLLENDGGTIDNTLLAAPTAFGDPAARQNLNLDVSNFGGNFRIFAQQSQVNAQVRWVAVLEAVEVVF